MSALNIVKQRDRLVLVTDGAVWDVNKGSRSRLTSNGCANPSTKTR
jgi:hypothetical protein